LTSGYREGIFTTTQWDTGIIKNTGEKGNQETDCPFLFIFSVKRNFILCIFFVYNWVVAQEFVSVNMDSVNMDEDVVLRLGSLLEQASATLARYNRQHWALWLAGDADRIKRGDATGIEHFLSALGGWAVSTMWSSTR
jgi:hypothetical protein